MRAFHYHAPLSIALTAALFATATFAQSPTQIGTVEPYSYESRRIERTATRAAAPLLADEHVVRFAGASFLCLEFGDSKLAEGSVLEIVSLADKESQMIASDGVRAGRSSAYFNGDAVRIRLWASGGTKANYYTIRSVAVGKPPSDVAGPATLCGNDDRVPANDRRICRIVFQQGGKTWSGSAGVISPTNCVISAGHNFSGGATRHIIQFDVPASKSNGTIVHPSPSKQWVAIGTPATTKFAVDATGDWAVFLVAKNWTGKYPGEVRGWLKIHPSMVKAKDTVEIYGFGSDTTPRTRNKVQQHRKGPVVEVTSMEIRYAADTMGGDSGAPILAHANGALRVVGVHTYGACHVASRKYNGGYRIDVKAFRDAIEQLCGHLPDWRALSIKTTDTRFKAGQSRSVTAKVINAGIGTPRSAARLGVLLSTNNTITESDLLLAATGLQPLVPNVSLEWRTNVRVPIDTPTRQCWLGAFADLDDTVPESDESNNTIATPVSCEGLPDLVPGTPVITPSRFVPEQIVSIRTSSTNAGFAPLGKALPAGHEVYLSRDATLSSTDQLLAAHTINDLRAKATQAHAVSVRMPANLAPGAWYIGSWIDRVGQLREIREDNNDRVTIATCLDPVPDLTVTDLTTTTTSWRPGSRVRVRSTVKNNGNAASRVASAGYYLSADATISATDTLLAGFAVPALAIDAKSSHVMTVTIPATVRTGKCYLGVFADDRSVQRELREDNNTRAVAGVCTGVPDLVVSALTADPGLTVGFPYSVTVMTRNAGGAASKATKTGLFLSADSVISTTDVYTGWVSVPSLAAGRAYRATARQVVPLCVRPRSGGYVGAIADVDEAVQPEVSESNNTASFRLTGIAASAATGTEFEPTWVRGGIRGGRNAARETEADFALSSANAAARSANICVLAPDLPNHWYHLMWSGSRRLSVDVFSSLSLGLMNSAVMPNWFGRLDDRGRESQPIRIALPRITGVSTFRVYGHTSFFRPDFSQWLGTRGKVLVFDVGS